MAAIPISSRLWTLRSLWRGSTAPRTAGITVRSGVDCLIMVRARRSDGAASRSGLHRARKDLPFERPGDSSPSRALTGLTGFPASLALDYGTQPLTRERPCVVDRARRNAVQGPFARSRRIRVGSDSMTRGARVSRCRPSFSSGRVRARRTAGVRRRPSRRTLRPRLTAVDDAAGGRAAVRTFTRREPNDGQPATNGPRSDF